MKASHRSIAFSTLSRFWPGLLRDLEVTRDVFFPRASLTTSPAVSETLFLVALRETLSGHACRPRFLVLGAMVVMEAVLTGG